ncbi:piggyBac transposable element-derived protein 4 [Electrophorus electricus]|nr:piggyBac transposable element-derived protein 4 [Electrophorus electricus]
MAACSMFSVSMTLELVRPYLGKGHVLYTDDQHNSPGLFRYLHKLGTSACGPVRLAWMPSFSENMETEFLHTDMLLAVKRRNLEDLPLLSSVHSTSMAINSKGDEEPECEADYSRAMRSSKHQIVHIDYANFGRTPLRWYHKVLLHLMTTTVQNAFMIYQSLSQKTTTFYSFQLDLINQLLKMNHPDLGAARTIAATVGIPMRLVGRHFPKPVTLDSAISSWCFVCQNTSTRASQLVKTSYTCVECQKPLCAVPCFEIYHTLKDY